MTVIQIVKEYLETHAYDGLYNEDGGCACEIADLAPCDGEIERCIAGYKVPCDGSLEMCSSGVKCLWHMRGEKIGHWFCSVWLCGNNTLKHQSSWVQERKEHG